jgi:hypothetical protein
MARKLTTMRICRTPPQGAVVAETMEIFCDNAEAILREALESEHEVDATSRRARPSEPAATVEQPPRQIALKWLDGTEFGMEIGGGGDPALIDARPVNGDEPSSARQGLKQPLSRYGRWSSAALPAPAQPYPARLRMSAIRVAAHFPPRAVGTPRSFSSRRHGEWVKSTRSA